ncbi:MAG: hypothetical protein WD512_03010, partial [Candidatus Paceibacterota bacterium]
QRGLRNYGLFTLIQKYSINRPQIRALPMNPYNMQIKKSPTNQSKIIIHNREIIKQKISIQ